MSYRKDTLLSDLFDKLEEAVFVDDKVENAPVVDPELDKKLTQQDKDSQKVIPDAVKSAEELTKDDEVKNQIDTPDAVKHDTKPPKIENNAPPKAKSESIKETFDIDASVLDAIVNELEIDVESIDVEQLKKGLKVEQEHEDITGGDKVLTAKLVLAHLKEIPDYYTRLAKMESDYKAEVKGEAEEETVPSEDEPAPESEPDETPSDESIVDETDVTYTVLATNITDKQIADRLAQDAKGVVMADADNKEKYTVVMREGDEGYQETRNELIKKSKRKPVEWVEADNNEIRYEQYKDYLDKLERIQLDGSRPLDDNLIPDELRRNSLIVTVDDVDYFVDPQGFDYARYVSKLVDFPNESVDEGGVIKKEDDGKYIARYRKGKGDIQTKEFPNKEDAEKFLKSLTEESVDEMKVTAYTVDYKEGFEGDMITKSLDEVGGKKIVYDFGGHGSDSKVMIFSSEPLTDMQQQELWDAGDFFLGDEVWDGKNVSDIVKKLQVYSDSQNENKKKISEEKFGKTISIEVEDGDDIKSYEVELSIDVVSDPNAGSDIDGNRGALNQYIDDWTIVSITDDAGNVVTETPEIISAIEGKLDDVDLTDLGGSESTVNGVREDSMNEGQFSWLLPDGTPIYSDEGHQKTVYMLDDKGNKFKETAYEGYGVFGGKDYFDLLAEMNGLKAEEGEELRQKGIDFAYSGSEAKIPRFATDENAKYEDLPNPKDDPNQGWYQKEESDIGYDEDEDEEDPYIDDMDENEVEEATGAEWAKAAGALSDDERAKITDSIATLLNWDYFKKEWNWTGLNTLATIMKLDVKENKIDETMQIDCINLYNKLRMIKCRSKKDNKIGESVKVIKRFIRESKKPKIKESKLREYRDMAERLFLMKVLKEKKNLNKIEKNFIKETLRIKLSGKERRLVHEQYLSITGK